MIDPDDLRAELHEIASTIDVGDAGVARAAVGGVVRRRRRRRMGAAVAGVILVAVTGVSVIAWAGRSTTPRVLVGVDPSTPTSTAGPSTTVAASTTTTPAPPAPPAEPRSVRPTNAVGTPVEAPPFASSDPGATFVAPWREGFLAIGPGPLGQLAEAQYSPDGIVWEPIEFAPPEGLIPDRYAIGGDRLVVIENTPGARSTITVRSSSDLVTWSSTTIEPVPPPIDLPAFVKPTLRSWGIVANADGWIVEGMQGVRLAAREIVPEADLAGIDDRTLISADLGEDGVTVTVGPDGRTWFYSWEELGVDAAQYEYIADGTNGASRWWAATWDGTPVPTSLSGVPTDEGFVSVGDRTMFSADGVTWTPAATLPPSDWPVTLPYGGGIIVVDPTDPSTFVHLDARGELIEELVVDGLAPVTMPYSLPWASTAALVYSSTGVPQPLQVMEHEGYRLSYDPVSTQLELVDLASGEIVVAENRETFEATGVSALAWNENGSITITDLDSGEAIVTFPSELVQQSMEDTSDAVSQFVPDLHLLATADGQEFLAVDLPDDDSDGGMYQTAVNGRIALVGINGAWTRYELP